MTWRAGGEVQGKRGEGAGAGIAPEGFHAVVPAGSGEQEGAVGADGEGTGVGGAGGEMARRGEGECGVIGAEHGDQFGTPQGGVGKGAVGGDLEVGGGGLSEVRRQEGGAGGLFQ